MHDLFPAFQCKPHRESASLFCALSEWHFEPLCQACALDHIKTHNGQQIKLLELQPLKKQFEQGRTKLLKSTSTLLLDLQSQRRNNDSIVQQFQEELNSICRRLTAPIEAHFAKLIAEVKSVYSSDTLLAAEADLSKVQSNLNAPTQDFVTKVLFRKQEEQLKAASHKCQPPRNKPQFHWDLKKAIDTLDSVIQSLSLQCQSKKQAPPKKAKPPGRKCKQCGGQMHYLTAFKKSWGCQSCGQKQRNYVKKND